MKKVGYQTCFGLILHLDWIMCFRDVLTFDITYQTNAYKKSLVMLVHVKYHHQTIVFDCALLIDENIGTYE